LSYSGLIAGGFSLPRLVIITSECFEKIIGFLGQYSNPLLPTKQWGEGFGFLFCQSTPHYYVVEDAIGAATGERAGGSLKGEEMAVVEFAREQRPDLHLGGWFHSHPGRGLFFSPTDQENQLAYQQDNQDGLGIVWDHTLVGQSGKGLGLKVFRIVDPAAIDYAEVNFQVSGFSQALLEQVYGALGFSNAAINSAWRQLEVGGITLSLDAEQVLKGEAIVGNLRDVLENSEEKVERVAKESREVAESSQQILW